VIKSSNFDSKVILKLLADLGMPHFYSDIAELEGFEMMQGSHFNDRAHYAKREQFVCNVEGFMNVTIVPYMFRQQLYVQPPN
jgi:hypothetical protein